MSFIFTVDRTTVWSPSLRVGEIWAGYASTLATSFGVESGLQYAAADLVQIDPAAFIAFVASIVDELNNQPHAVLEQELRVVATVSLVLLERAGLNDGRLDQGSPLAAEARKLSAAMPA